MTNPPTQDKPVTGLARSRNVWREANPAASHEKDTGCRYAMKQTFKDSLS